MTSPHLVLASASPRRRELLALFGVPFATVATNAEESDTPPPSAVLAALPPFPLPPDQHPALLAWRKAHAASSEHDADVILGADTIVTQNGSIMNKPRDATHAHAILSQLSGKMHTVYTGVCVLTKHPPLSPETLPHQTPLAPHFVTFALVAANVHIAPLSAETIAAYVATGEPLDKAGAYGIQGEGGKLVERVEGSYTAVVGLPLAATHHLLTAAGIATLTDPTTAYHSWLHTNGKEPLPCPPTRP